MVVKIKICLLCKMIDNHQMMTKLEKLNECQVDGTTVREEKGVILGYVQGERVGLFVVNTFSIME